MGWWQRHFNDATRGRIVALLRRESRTAAQLGQQLGISGNAVRAQLAELQRDGVVAPGSVRRDGAVGKPATVYGVAPYAAVMFSSAYAPLLSALLAELGNRLTPRQLEAALRGAGRRLAPQPPEKAGLEERVQAGVRLLTEFGAEADLVEREDGYEIRGHGCVLSEAVLACRSTCRAVEALLAEVTGARVHEHCDRTGEPHCRFSITTSI